VVISSYLDKFGYKSFCSFSFDVKQEVDRVGNIQADGRIWQFHSALKNAAGKTIERLRS
jgi:hypothetical protein